MHAVGIDPVHFGIIVTLNLAIGQQTPPVASVLIATCSNAEANIWEVTKVNVWFIGVLLVGSNLAPLTMTAPSVVLRSLAMLIQPARREYRTWIIDSRGWEHYRPRPTDIVIATYPKCGTTWMQRIVGLLVFQTPEPRPLMAISPWIDPRFPEPIEAVMARIEAQEHRRFLKSHLPADGLPIYDQVSYIHVARDGRDACLSFHNHLSAFTPEMLAMLDRAGLEDDAIGRPYPRASADAARHFHRWLTEGAVPGHEDGTPAMSFFHFERSWWDERHRDNVILVHHKDLKADLAGEMRRVADFLGIAIPSGIGPELVQAAGFEAMRRDGEALMGNTAAIFQGGSGRFFHKGTNERWRGVFGDDDLALYDAKVTATLSPDCARWVANGRLATDWRTFPGPRR